MIRYWIIVVSAVFYVALSAWLVGKQGQAYRDGLRRDHVVETAKGEKPTAPEPALKNAAVAADSQEIAATELHATEPEEPAVSEPSTKKARQPTKQRRQTTGKGTPKTKPAESTAAHESSGNPSVKTAADGDPLAGNPFWTQAEMMRNWDVASMSAADEQKLGALLHDVIVQLNPVAADGPWRQALRRRCAAGAVSACVQLQGDPLSLRDHGKQIRSTPSYSGGYVYVSRGLFELIGEDEDYALQFAVGNEIAHVDLVGVRLHPVPGRRGLQKMNGGTTGRKLYWVVIPLGYLVSTRSIRILKRTSIRRRADAASDARSNT